MWQETTTTGAEAQEIPGALRGPKGPLFHDDADPRSFPPTYEAVPLPKAICEMA